MVRQIVGTIIGTLLFCVVALSILDYAGVVKIFNINRLAHTISSDTIVTTGDVVIGSGMAVYDGKACPVGMRVIIMSGNTLVCKEAETIGHDCIGLDGEIVAHGSTVSGFKSNYDTCDSIARLCQDGVLGGDPSYALSSCHTYLPSAQNCSVSDDLVVAEHKTIVRWGDDKTDKDTSCAYIKMVCSGGILEGVESFTESGCMFKQSLSASYLQSHPHYKGVSGDTVGLEYVAIPGGKSCTTSRGSGVEDGKSILSFQYQTVPYKDKCVYNLSYCKDGVLDDNILKYPSCQVEAPASCTTPRNTAIKHGETFSGYQMIQQNGTSVCESELRICLDGKLSGSYGLRGCTETPKVIIPPVPKKVVLPVGQCKTPRGKWIDNGKSVTAYQAYGVAYDQNCQSETRICRDGVLDGSFTAKSCTVGEVKTCMTPWGTSVKHGESVFAYADKSVGYGSVCASETRYCNDGILDGSFQYATCSVGKPSECPLPRGGTLIHGQSVFAYQKTQVPYGQTCASVAEQRRCTNGILGGSYMFEGCEVETAADCATNRGTIKHGKTIARYQSPQVYGQVADGTDQCVRFTLTCTNGQVAGTLVDHPEAVYKSCNVVFPDDPN